MSRYIRAVDPSPNSDMYWIDPDGRGIDDDPIYVYCNMDMKGIRILFRKTGGNVGKRHVFKVQPPFCTEANRRLTWSTALIPNAIPQSINYNATNSQIEALIQLSDKCY